MMKILCSVWNFSNLLDQATNHIILLLLQVVDYKVTTKRGSTTFVQSGTYYICYHYILYDKCKNIKNLQNDKIVSLIFLYVALKYSRNLCTCVLYDAQYSQVNCTTCIIQGAFNFDITISQLHQGIMGKSLKNKIELLYHNFF